MHAVTGTSRRRAYLQAGGGGAVPAAGPVRSREVVGGLVSVSSARPVRSRWSWARVRNRACWRRLLLPVLDKVTVHYIIAAAATSKLRKEISSPQICLRP
jgi:hypothetical protein